MATEPFPFIVFIIRRSYVFFLKILGNIILYIIFLVNIFDKSNTVFIGKDKPYPCFAPCRQKTQQRNHPSVGCKKPPRVKRGGSRQKVSSKAGKEIMKPFR